MASSNHPLLRVAFRASLLGGGLLDAGLAVTALAVSPGRAETFLSYPPVLLPLILVRIGVQVLACYDRRRYDPLIPLVALSWIAVYLPSLLLESANWSENLATALLGLAQLILWRTPR